MWCLQSGELHPHKFNEFMAALLEKNSKDLYRSKGVIALVGEGDTKFVFQGVHEQIMFTPAPSKWAPGQERVNKMVFIGESDETCVWPVVIVWCARSQFGQGDATTEVRRVPC